MAEEDFSALVTSIDENDIEIIASNGSEYNGHLDFVFDNRNIQPATVPVQTTRLIREDSEDFEDETLIERLYGLTEMFPNWFQTFFQNSYQYSKSIGQFLKKSIWFCSSSFLILLLPILIQLEYSQVAEMQAAQTRQILLGPSAQIGVGQN